MAGVIVHVVEILEEQDTFKQAAEVAHKTALSPNPTSGAKSGKRQKLPFDSIPLDDLSSH